MIPQEVFKRRQRHNNTPESILLIISNFIVVSVAASLFTSKGQINWFFWVIIGLLAGYNFYTIRRNREEYTKITIVAYLSSVIILIGFFFLLRSK